MSQLLSETKSLCPECLSLIPARRVAENGNIYLEKDCPEHGKYQTIIWRQGADHYFDWGKYSEPPTGPLTSLTDTDQGCPFDCGLCARHQTNACTMVMEVTARCNLLCPVCFANAGKLPGDEPDLQTIREMYQTVLDATGTPTIQLSGGEPTVREDLPEIVALGRQMGFRHIMVNSNGLRIAQDKEYLRRLVESGASAIYLQFDGITDDVYDYTRGANLTRLKIEAIANCTQAKIGVILVPTVVPGVNDHQLGDIFRFAKRWIPTVRGIHLQPVTYLGRCPVVPTDKDRITIPEVIEALCQQTGGELKPENFIPAHCGESHCSFSSLFFLGDNGRLLPTTKRLADEFVSTWGNLKKPPEESARSFMDLHWRFNEEQSDSCGCAPGVDELSTKPMTGTLDELYQRVLTRGLSITCMPFQDVWTLDLERLEKCCSHVVTPDKRIIPFCAYYLTSVSGQRLYSRDSVQSVVSK